MEVNNHFTTQFPLTIVSPQGQIFNDTVVFLKARGLDGEFAILAHHSPLVKILAKGIIQLRGEHFEQFLSMDSGVLEVNEKGETLVLVDNAVLNQDSSKAQSSLATWN